MTAKAPTPKPPGLRKPKLRAVTFPTDPPEDTTAEAWWCIGTRRDGNACLHGPGDHREWDGCHVDGCHCLHYVTIEPQP